MRQYVPLKHVCVCIYIYIYLYIYISTALHTIRQYVSEVSGTDGEEEWLSSIGGLDTSNPGPSMVP
jgi:hypothetical protein